VVQLLQDIEWHRARLADADAVLSDWLLNSPDFSQAWHDFTAAGGISGHDFHAFMSGNFRRRLGVRQHQHLRLIASREAAIPRAARSAAATTTVRRRRREGKDLSNDATYERPSDDAFELL
jgi:hypothetical protein